MHAIEHRSGNPPLPVPNHCRNFFLFLSRRPVERPDPITLLGSIHASRALGALYAHDGCGRVNLDSRGSAESFADSGPQLAAELAKDRWLGQRFGADPHLVDGQQSVFTQPQGRVVHEHDLGRRIQPRTQRVTDPDPLVHCRRTPSGLRRGPPIHLTVHIRHESNGLSGKTRRGNAQDTESCGEGQTDSVRRGPRAAEGTRDSMGGGRISSHGRPLGNRASESPEPGAKIAPS